MKSIINEKKDMIANIFVYQIAMSLLGVFVVSPFNGYVQIAASVFAILFYFSLVCYAVIEDGQKDCISHKAGRMVGNPASGLVYSLVSYIPTVVIVIAQCLLNLFTDYNVLAGLKSIINVVIRFFLMGMYLGVDTGLVQRTYDSVNQTSVIVKGSDFLVFMSDNYLVFSVCLIFLPVVAGITYKLAFDGKIHVNTAPKKGK